MRPSARPAVTRRRRWILIAAAVALAAAAVFDWQRPPAQQVSVLMFERGVIAPYRAFARPTLRRVIVCRFSPTCSGYAQIAMHYHGFPRGLWLTVKRLVRCNPWAKPGTHDPVPPVER
jgi:putative membrane protein insertion efficiency factor